MFSRILVAVHSFADSDPALTLVQRMATAGQTEVQVLHLRERELSGYSWYSRETGDQASFVAEAAIFKLRMAGISAAGEVRYAIVDRVAEAILREAAEFEADLIVLGRPRRGELATRLLGSVTMRVLRRSSCPVLVAPRREPRREETTAAGARGSAS